MKICAVSDIHGHLPKIPDCDLLLLGGDFCPTYVGRNDADIERYWYHSTFASWIEFLSERMKIIGVAGNHDFIFEREPHKVPEMPWTYLQDSETEFNGLRIYGSPWQPTFFNWAFNLEEYQLQEKWALIPQGIDILLLHGPPLGYGDFSPYGKVHTGSPSLLAKIEEIKPKLVVAGHIHSGYGKYNIGDTIFLSASLVNERYKPVNPVHVIEI